MSTNQKLALPHKVQAKPWPSTAPLFSPSLFSVRGPRQRLKGGVKVCKRTLVNEVLGLLLTEFFPDPTHKGATPIQRRL